MSATLQGAAYYLPIGRAEKLTLCAMADHANDDGAGVWPGNTKLATKTSQSVRNLQRHLRALQRAGLIAPVKNPQGGRGLAVEWEINADLVYAVARANGWTQRTRTTTRMSPFPPRKGDTTARNHDKTGTETMTPVSPQPSENHQNHTELSTDTDPPLLTETHPRAPGEPLGDYLTRIATLHAQTRGA